jgi:hypothetical protein
MYIQYLNSFQSLGEFKEILKNIKDIDSINKIRILPIKKKFTNNNECKECKWPINFELVHEILYNKLLDIYKKSENEMNEIKVFQSQYKIYFGHSTLYINYLKNPIYFFAYNYDINNNSCNLFAIIKCNGNIFHELLSKLLTLTFQQFLIQMKIDLNKKNIFQLIMNSQKQKVLEVLLFFENNNINSKQFQNIIDSNMNNNNIELILNNHNQTDIIQNNKKKEMDHCLGLENIDATCYMNPTIQCLCHIRSLTL